MSNVVKFPKGKKNSPPQTFEELIDSIQKVKKEHVEFLVDEVFQFVFSRCMEDGFDLTDDDCIKSTGFLLEAFRSALLKSVEIYHPIQDIADDVFDDMETDDEEIEELTKQEIEKIITNVLKDTEE